MLLRLFYYIRGYVRISVSGSFPERFLNLCAAFGLHLWGVFREDGKINACCSAAAFLKMRRAAKKSGCRIKIVKKTGLYFALRRLTRRRVLIFGTVIFAAALLLSSSFIWTVRVDGNENMTESEIKFLAESCGLKQGVVKYKVNTRKFEEAALLSEPRLAWIYPEVKGTVLYIHVREKTEFSPPEDVKAPCEVVARRSGVIEKITVKRGRALVKKGDTVTKGRVLITGDGYLHADGSVTASFWVQKTKKLTGEKRVTRYTGREKTRYTVKIGDFGMRLAFSGKKPFDECEITESTKNLVIFGDIPLPVTVKSEHCKETYTVKEKITAEEEAENEKEKITAEYEKELPDGVVLSEVTHEIEEAEDGAYLKVTFRCTRDIALKDYSHTEE